MIVGSLQEKESIVNHTFDSLPFPGISWLKKERYLKNGMDQIWCSCTLPSKFQKLWGKVILELFTVAHPHVELRYLLINNKEIKVIKLLTALKWSILLIGCSGVNILIIWNCKQTKFSWKWSLIFSWKWSLIILILIICYWKR